MVCAIFYRQLVLLRIHKFQLPADVFQAYSVGSAAVSMRGLGIAYREYKVGINQLQIYIDRGLSIALFIPCLNAFSTNASIMSGATVAVPGSAGLLKFITTSSLSLSFSRAR